MFSKKPKPTPEQLREARHMLGDLEQLFEAGKESAYASEIREVLAGGGEALETWLSSGNFWGGMGSMIDCAFCAPSGLGYDIDKRNRREFMKLIVKLGKHQLTSGILTAGIKPHIQKWTGVFEGWLSSNAV